MAKSILIIACHLLLLAVYFKASNSRTRTPTPNIHQEERRTSSSSTRTRPPTIDHGERRTSSSNTRTRTPNIHQEERRTSSSSTRTRPPTIDHGERHTSSSNTRTHAPTIDHGERRTSSSNTRTHPPAIDHGERRTSSSNTRTHTPTIDHWERRTSKSNTKTGPPTILHEERWTTNRTCLLNRQYTAWISGLGLHTGIPSDYTLVGHSNHQKFAMSTSTVKDCPADCDCVFMLDWFFHIWKLQVKDCKSDPLTKLPKLFDSQANITILELNSCRLTTLPQAILKLHNLQNLILIKNNFTVLPSQVSEMPQLRGLWIEANEAELVVTDITQLSELRVLLLVQNKIAALPPDIGNMRRLGYLNVTANALQSLPREIGDLSQLLDLDISCNYIQSLPEEVLALSKLKHLLLGFNELETLPSALGKLTNLKGISLEYNKLRTLPNDTLKLNQLEMVVLSYNLLQEFPPLPKERLTGLALDDNKIDLVSCKLFTESQLEMLDMGYNDLKTFDCVQTNVHLTSLVLAHNSLEELSCTYGMLSLTALDLSYNYISSLPVDCVPFGHSMYLDWLSLSSNQISSLHFKQLCSQAFKGSFAFLDFSNNLISILDTKYSTLSQCFRTRAIIDLSNNRISSLDSWPLFIAETVPILLDVSGNNLSEFTNTAGTFLPTFKTGTEFVLQQNQIRHFMDVFDGWKIIVNTTENMNILLQNVYFDLGGNPLICDCIDYEIYKYIQPLTTDHYKNLVCHEPLTLRGQNTTEIPLGNFVCDIKMNCPESCICSKVPHSQSINVTCKSYIQIDIPEIVPDLPNENYGYQLDICNQNLSEITSKAYLQKTFEMLLSNNSITAIEINSSTAFQSLKILHLDNNLLQRLPESVTGMTNKTVEEITLGSNPWVCDCEAMGMKNWIMLNLNIVKDKDNVYCHSPPSMVGVKVRNIERSMVCPDENMTAVYVVAAMAIAVVLILLYVAITNRLKYANWRLVGSDECEGEHKEFDVFMCSADGDSGFVENILIPELERRDFRVCYHREHFCGGKPIHVNMSEAIEKSKRTLVLFTNNFKQSEFSMFEFNSAYDLDIRNKTRRLVTIKDPDLEMDDLERSVVHYFETHTYIRREDERFWYNLEYSLPRRRLGAQVRQPNT